MLSRTWINLNIAWREIVWCGFASLLSTLAHQEISSHLCLLLRHLCVMNCTSPLSTFSKMKTKKQKPYLHNMKWNDMENWQSLIILPYFQSCNTFFLRIIKKKAIVIAMIQSRRKDTKSSNLTWKYDAITKIRWKNQREREARERTEMSKINWRKSKEIRNLK